MGQQEILDYLKTNADKWLFSREIYRALGITSSCVTHSLRSLRAGKLVNFRNVGSKQIFQYKYVE